MAKIVSNTLVAAAMALIAAAPGAALADPVADFYRGKQFNIYSGTGENSTGSVVQYGRAVAQIIGKYIPGEPTVIYRFMPGAGGIKAANFLYGIAPQDGTALGSISRGFIVQPLLGNPAVQFDPTKFNWIGSTASEVSVGAYWTAGTSARTIQDAMRQEIIVGGTAPSQDTGLYPVVLNRLIGTKFKVITGYKSSSEVDLAMQKGEVQGKIGWTWGNLNSGHSATWVKDHTVTVFIQLGVERSPHVPADVPVLGDLARSDDDRKLMHLIFGTTATGYPSFVGPGVSKERVEAIRAAYRATMKDPEFRQILAKQKLEVDPIEGDVIADMVKKIFDVPPAVKKRAREIMSPP
jgi:tripartite-type tricarboxylate transporter receptor subunit TctC